MSEDGTPVQHHILSVLVENKFGVLSRVAGLFARRGFNIVSLAVSPTEDERFSRMTIVVDAESAPLEQITKQLNKLIPVIKIAELHPDEAVERELMLVTVKATPELRSQITELASIFQARIDDVGHDALTIQVAGAPQKLDAMTDLQMAPQMGVWRLLEQDSATLAVHAALLHTGKGGLFAGCWISCHSHRRRTTRLRIVARIARVVARRRVSADVCRCRRRRRPATSRRAAPASTPRPR